ncbi:hypothetical protein P691DRAFT_687774 [Macrolepiota fuliginosa MF-IS2]|uniref:Uncharacterized protein n=1 Tax=Macrolepiota fuliginosa MF-IS2 TaxID=1400762 RepID=A0A9P6BWC8_9AGAR|nr:hypothetical protein P691DRAFT_687774 [Macrolepiota fuliginosa MF-IS2]
MHGPLRHQFYLMAPTIPQGSALPQLVNRSLACTKSTLKVDSVHISPCGLTFATASIPSTSDLDTLEATFSAKLPGAQVSIPALQSFIKIMDVPYFKSSTTEPFLITELNAQLKHSIIPPDFIVHLHFTCNSPKADSATIWIDLSDLQRGTRASQLISHCLFLNNVEVLIKGAKAHTGMPQCQCCWKWGHTTDACCCPAIHCPICSGPHSRASHCSLARCC